jgi:hypothetical protein
MLGKKTKRLLAVATTGVAAFGLVATATGYTGAYFTEAKAGSITGTIGAVHVATSGGSGGNGLDFAFSNLMPGEPQTITLNYQNTGTGPEDIYLTFPNIPALHALNNLGSYGEVHVADSSSGPVFDSANLNDGRTKPPPNPATDYGLDSCGALSPAGCWPLPTAVRVRSNLPAGGSGSATFTFSYAAKLGGNGPGTWNSYPAISGVPLQSFGPDAAGPAGNGLPYNVVATQVGHAP